MTYVTANTEAITWDSITYEMTSDAWYYITVTWHVQSGLILCINGFKVAQLDSKERVPPVNICLKLPLLVKCSDSGK